MARAAALEALAIDETLSEAHASLGYVLMRRDRDFDGARREFERAIELKPGYATAHHWYGCLFTLLGETDRALECLRRAERIDPLSVIVRSDVAWALYFGRRYDEAAAQCANVLRFDAGFRPARRCLAQIHIQRGRYEDALTECRIAGISDSVTAGVALARAGRTAEALAIVTRHRQAFKAGRQAAFQAAWILTALDDKRKALLWLDKSFAAGEERIGYIRVEPGFDDLREEAAFKDLLARLGPT
jgi:tetratricopeptide (TPR) repeat protein